MSSLRRAAPQTQPRTYRLSLKGLLLLPFRICNPPPAVGKVRSCSVTPVFDVRLEDVLDRKHLPPLGLKDFEEWLLHVERSPENLYFALWLKEYTVRYKQWTLQQKSLCRDSDQYQMDWPPHTSSHLAMFYARAKQTFFTPNSNYELNLPSDLLAPFHSSNVPLHPDPAVFDQVAIETRQMLKDSLRRFVSAQFNNVGNNRVLCGMIAGTVCCLVGAVLPIVYNLVLGRSRWLRLTAMPGLWLGLTLLLTSINGICLGVYVFGDLRQLRKFELSRPPISKPQPLRQRPVISSPITGLRITPIIPLYRPSQSRLPTSPTTTHSLQRDTSLQSISVSSCGPAPLPPVHSQSRYSRPPSQLTAISSASYCSQPGSMSDESCYISPAIYDPNPVDGPATGVLTFPPEHMQPKSTFDDDEDNLFSTATFIHPYEEDDDDEYSYQPKKVLPEERQRIDSFDFDSLPPRVGLRCDTSVSPRSFRAAIPQIPPPTSSNTSLPTMTPNVMVIQPEAEPVEQSLTPKAFIRRIQSRCNINKWLVITSPASSTDLQSGTSEKTDSEYSSNFPRPHPSFSSASVDVGKQFKMVKAVPAFASPLTRIHSPIVVRGQWEIVVRSMVIACFVSWAIIGSLLAVPVMKAHGHQ
ncbi:hypothetical protein Moror_14003 [Moniliophthora roreri MCA 2997]|uniref:RGS domain-containing protein n=2 Tax=Moniliophthora roreri TaxID=221103 RepID=V2X751_MONRO|nr:hypothetical protein Moror_14003 [Moniliophthora roreri MCA 2997]KAI3607438.1 hypothetical protein WG66_005073 [Moniliophthora roreri]